MMTMNLTDIGKQIKATTEAIAKADAELKWEMAASAADVAGMIDPTPASDLIGAGLAVRKGDWLGAGMSVASMVPYVGDALAKPAKAVRAAKRINELRQTIAKLTAKLADLRKTEKQAETAAKQAGDQVAAQSAKKTADGQTATSKANKERDCEDCGTGKGEPNGSGKKPKHGKLAETPVPCFHPFDKKKFARLSVDEKKAYLKEMSKQLSRQQDAINNVTANEFKAARDAFDANKRNPVAASMQESRRAEIKSMIQDSIYESLLVKGVPLREANTKATQRATEVMEKLAALHEPDMVAGGYLNPEPSSIGRADVNSSIGASWNQRGRIAALDSAANEAIEAGAGSDKMNVKLEPCRGKEKK